MEDLKYMYFSIFLILYIAIVAENVILIGVIYTERTLHQPMYFLVCNLAANDLYGSTALLPAVLSNLATHSSEVSLAGCRTQIFCIYTYAIIEFTILGIMSYDRYVAICHPLQYQTIMSLTKVYKHIVMILYSYAYILRVCALSSKESKLKALRTCTPHLFAIINYSVGCFFEIVQSRLDTSNLSYRTQVFMSLYFLIFPPILNPAIYGLSLQAIRVKLFKRCDVKV
ncbi:olfactory receptor 52E4-like [Coregonus clupeaformis]|uniref:olfactory receptor 52E4-like n=1 Tax=Coregonus clupeaformis TaxID=59861 RepID=UPI001BE069CA|nr:olfactory receptor 52E4-like [Coregonus clupeaformis]